MEITRMTLWVRLYKIFGGSYPSLVKQKLQNNRGIHPYFWNKSRTPNIERDTTISV